MFSRLEEYDHQQIVFARDEKTGLKTIVAIHDTTLGPACGGTRFFDYASEEDALYDVLRLSRGMTLKNAAAGIKLGGGKGVIIGDPKKLKSREFFNAYGRVIDSLGGMFYTGEDMNISPEDVAYVNETTKYVTGTPGISGSPSPFTARGVFRGLKAGAGVKYGSESFDGKTVVVQGLGTVGYDLCGLLFKEGAKLKVFDVKEDLVQKAASEFGAEVLAADEVLGADCDIFSPCAIGAILNRDNVRGLKCGIICGAANNVLVDKETGDILKELDILYLPDYIVNAGGIISVGEEVLSDDYNVHSVNAKVDKIYDTTLKIIEIAKERDISTYAAADEYAMGIVLAGRK